MNTSRLLYFIGPYVLLLSAVVHADPRIQYSSYLSGSKTSCVDELNNPCIAPGVPYARAIGVAVDGSGSIYVAGITNETDFPNTKGQKVPVFCETDGSACRPATSFLTKFSASGQLLYSTFLPSGVQVYGLAVDRNGNAYVTGNTNLAEGSFREFGGIVDKFTPTGSLVYQITLIAAGCVDAQDTPLAIILNSAGTAAYVAGRSNDFGTGCAPTTLGAYERNPNFGPGLWVVKLNISQASSATLTYGTYVGPLSVPSDLTTIQAEGLGGLAVDGSGHAYITGWVNSELKWPTTTGAYRTTAPGGLDGFVSKLNSTGTALVYSTYIGGTGTDLPTGIRVDSAGNAYIAGTTTSSTFPHTKTFGSGTAVSFATRLNSAGSGLLYSTLLYGDSASGIAASTNVDISSPDIIVGGSNSTLALDSGGNAYVVGFSNSTGFFKSIPFQSSLRGATDAAYTSLNQSGSPITSSYLGGSGTEAVVREVNLSSSAFQQFDDAAIFVDGAWNSYVVGTTNSTDFPVTTNAFQKTLKGNTAVFLTKIIIDADLSLTASPGPSPVTHGANLTYTYTVTNKGPDSSDGDTLSTSIPTGTTFVSFTTTAGQCFHPTVGGTGAFTCKRGSLLLTGHTWGPITLTVKVNTASGGTISNFTKVTAKTQDVNMSNNSASTTVKVQ